MPAADPHRGDTLNGSLIRILVTLGHASQHGNTGDVIYSRISGSRKPLDPRYVQPTPRRDDDLDVQPSRGPREVVNVTGDIIDNYFEENLTDVLKVSGLGSNFSAYLQPTRDSNITTHPSE